MNWFETKRAWIRNLRRHRRVDNRLKVAMAFLGCGCIAVATTFVVAQTNSRSDLGSSRSEPTAPPTAIHTNRASFRIPYQYDPHEIARLGAREIRLFASLDRGNSWQHVQTVAPSAGRFDFQANRDDEYWFAVRTLDGQGQLHPGAEAGPGLIVVVDTQMPRFTVDLREREPGKVELNWNATDPNLAVETLKLEFTQPGQADWLPVGAQPQAAGQTTWSLASGGLIRVRGQIQDKAGNTARSQYQIQIRPGQGGAGTLAVPPPGPVAGLPTGTQFGGTTPNPFSSLFGMNQGAPANQAPPTPFPQPGQNYQTAQSPLPQVNSSNLHNQFDRPSMQPRPIEGRLNDPFASIPPAPAPGQSIPQQSGVPFNIGFPGQLQADMGTAQFRPVSDRSGYRTVNSRRFQIDYRIDDIGPSGVSAVQLYVTQNDGQKWYLYGVDEDRRSPFEIEVPGDGLFGFVIRVMSGAGLSDPPPQPGQKPDIVVAVDSSPPVVQLFPLRQGQGRESNRILITWQAADQQLSDAPIALSYSANANGPWEPITPGWHPNSGQYIWNVGPNVPPRLFVRLIARDTAGNLAKVDTPQPVLVDLAKPTARIVDVESNQNGLRN